MVIRFDPGRLFDFSYQLSRKKDRAQDPHETRDGVAFACLACTLSELGWHYGGILFNYPADPPPQPFPVDTSFLGPRDLLVLATRPPMDDSGRRVVPRSYTALEQRIFDCCRPFLELCCRSQIRLAPEMARLLPAGFENRAD